MYVQTPDLRCRSLPRPIWEDVGGPGEAAASAAGGPPAPGLSSGHISPLLSLQAASGPSVTWADGGQYAKLSLPSGRQGGGGGKRAAVSSFTSRSRRRLLRGLNSLDFRRIDVACFVFITLTYPAEFPSPRAAKRHLDKFLKRLRRQYPECLGWWKLEPQERKAPHFHLLLLMPQAVSQVDGDGQVITVRKRDGRLVTRATDYLLELRQWIAPAWYDVVGSGDYRHLLAGTQADGLATVRGCAFYAAKYMGKLIDGNGWESPGRWWGRVNKAGVNRLISEQSEQISQAVGLVLRRGLRRYLGSKPVTGGGAVLCRVFDEDGELVRVRRRPRGGGPAPAGASGRPGPVFMESGARRQLVQLGYRVEPVRRRRVPQFHLGLSVFMPSAEFARLVEWAKREAEAARERRILDLLDMVPERVPVGWPDAVAPF